MILLLRFEACLLVVVVVVVVLCLFVCFIQWNNAFFSSFIFYFLQSLGRFVDVFTVCAPADWYCGPCAPAPKSYAPAIQGPLCSCHPFGFVVHQHLAHAEVISYDVGAFCSVDGNR